MNTTRLDEIRDLIFALQTQIDDVKAMGAMMQENMDDLKGAFSKLNIFE